MKRRKTPFVLSSRAPATDAVATRRYVVDRKEGTFLVLERDDGTILDVEADRLPRDCQKEGTVFDVAADDWSKATRNRDEEQRRNRENKKTLDQLKKKDRGGDVNL